MLKRAAPEDSDDGPAQKQKAPGKGSSTGMKADDVDNPIPRLFRENTITIHISQRTFEEIGPGQLKWVPTSQYWAAMFDKFHWLQFKTYFDRCSTFEISNPKVRLSNLLMLQDEQTTEANTPKDVSIFTQACYLLHLEPNSPKNWFKLGTTDNCMTSQKLLKYKPLNPTDCNKYITQLVTVGEQVYKDFEQLTLNPCKPDAYAGWSYLETNATKTDTTELTCQNVVPGEVDIDTTTMDKNVDYYVSDPYISPYSKTLGDFSCSVKGCDPYIEPGKHTTYFRNLDKISLHKYGDTISWDVNTNMKGIPMLRHEANTPFVHKFMKKSKDARKQEDLEVYATFCYPSDNRPFYGRRDNFTAIAPTEHNKEFAPLKHHFLTMPPIRKGDGSLIKQRCSFIMEQHVSVTFHMPETAAESESQYMLDQKKGVILRPAVIKIKRINTEETPEKPPIRPWDPIREKLREIIRDRTHINPLNPDDLSNRLDTLIGGRTADQNRRWSLPAYIANFCNQLGIGENCEDLSRLITVARGNAPIALDWNDLPIGYVPPKGDYEGEVITFNDKIVPKWEPKLKYDENLEPPLKPDEFKYMMHYDIKVRQSILAMYLFVRFRLWHMRNNLPMPEVFEEMPHDIYSQQDLRFNTAFFNWLRPHSEVAVTDMYNSRCSAKAIRVWPNRMEGAHWSRGLGDYDRWTRMKITEGGPFTFMVHHWIEFLYYMGVYPLPSYLDMNRLINGYNECIDKQLDKQYPTIELTEAQIKELKAKGLWEPDNKLFKQRVEPIPPITDEWSNYETSTFFV